ncbi:hypothetical protein [Terrisporobacter sp.]|uniref:hypothetical protein n=1 Tax=Terrisporobacter sp. TaxID=1965305 RepID=UPI00289CBBEB|nr:hypothetical protein [Terrisporobacter sp.]
MKKYKLIDTVTNECNGEIELRNDEEIITKKKLSTKQRFFLNKENELAADSYLNGGYIHMFYVKNEILFNDIGLKPNTITRLIYLATYLDYSVEHKKFGTLVKIGKDNKRIPMTRKDIKEIMQLKDTQFKEFIKELKHKNILYEMDKCFYLNNTYFTKGRTNTEREKSNIYNYYTRVYIEVIRQLYSKFKSSKHKQLGYVFQLVPFMNYEDCRLVKYDNSKLDTKDICSLLGLSTDKGNMSKLKRDLKKITFINSNKEYYLFARVEIGEHEAWHINPLALWSGKELETKKYIAKILGLDISLDEMNLKSKAWM